MEKSSHAAGTNNGPRRAPEGAGTSTQSGVTVYEPSSGMNHPPPPSYDQATGAASIPAATTVTHNVTYNTTTSTQWGQTGAPIAASTQYVTYTTPASSSTTTYHYAPVQPPPPPATHQPHVHQQQPGQASVVIIQRKYLHPPKKGNIYFFKLVEHFSLGVFVEGNFLDAFLLSQR